MYIVYTRIKSSPVADRMYRFFLVFFCTRSDHTPGMRLIKYLYTTVALAVMCAAMTTSAWATPCNTYPGVVPLPVVVCPTRPSGRTVLCHRTSSETNPWNVIVVATESDVLHHLTCHGDVYAGSWVDGLYYGCDCSVTSATPMASPTSMPVPTPATTPLATPTPVSVGTPTPAPMPTPAHTPIPSPVSTPTSTSVVTPVPIHTPTPTPMAPSGTTPVPVTTPASTPVVTPTSTATPMHTPIPSPVSTPVATPVPTPTPMTPSGATPVPVATPTFTPVVSPTSVATPTFSPIPTPTHTPIPSPVSTPTSPPGATPVPATTPTFTPVATPTPVTTPMTTPVSTPVPTPIAVPTPSPSTVPPTCSRCDSCDGVDGPCTWTNCTEICPNGGVCGQDGLTCECLPCPDDDTCLVDLCIIYQDHDIMLSTVACSTLNVVFGEGKGFWPVTFFNGTFYDAQCVAQHGNGTNNTLPPLCDCDEASGTCVKVNCSIQCFGSDEAICNATTHLCECPPLPPANCTNTTFRAPTCDCDEVEDPSCVQVDCAAQCPEGVEYSCNSETHLCECGACPESPCKVTICHHHYGHPMYTLNNVSCASLQTHLGHGDFFPGSLVNGTLLYDANCTLVPELPCNETAPCERIPRCNCPSFEDPNCTVVDCSVLCPNDGECDAESGQCMCAPCPIDPVPSVCGNGIVDQDSEECDGGVYCLENCTLPRAWPYCVYLQCDEPPVVPLDAITWFTTHCRCVNGPHGPFTPDELRDECGNYDGQVVCPVDLYDTSGIGYWFAAMGGLLFVHTILAYAGSFL